MNGVGGVLNRIAVELIAYGTEISSVEDFIEKLEVACPNISLTNITKALHKQELFTIHCMIMVL